MTTSIDHLSRLLQLASPALPVGAYSYSGGLEAAVETGIVSDAADAARWVGDVLEFPIARMEAPLLVRLHAAWEADDRAEAARWNALFIASRETAELRAETLQMGYSLAQLLAELGVGTVELNEISYPAAFAFAAARWQIKARAALEAYLWSWLENQVMAAIKCVPLGQTAGQKILFNLGGKLRRVAEAAMSIADEDIANFTPALAILSSGHETQYSRLFRS